MFRSESISLSTASISVDALTHGRTLPIVKVLEFTTFFGLLVVLAVTAIPYGGVQPWWEYATVSTIFLLCSLRFVEGMVLANDLHLSGFSMLLPLFAIVLFAFIQTLPLGGLSFREVAGLRGSAISTDVYETRKFAFQLLAMTLAGESLLRYSNTRRRLRTLVYVVVGTGVASALLGIVRQLAQVEPDFPLPDLNPGVGYAQFINRNHFAFLMEMTLGLLLGLLLGRNAHRQYFMLFLAASVLVWVAVVFANSRGGLVSMMGQIVFGAVLAIITWRSSIEREYEVQRGLLRKALFALLCLVLAGSIAVVMAIGISWVGGDPVVTRIETISGELEIDDDVKMKRLDIWRSTWQLFEAHPVAGVGFGGYWTAITGYVTTSGGRSLQQAHNDYLELLASGGVVGSLLVIWFVVALIRRVRRMLALNDPFRRNVCLGAATGLIGVAIHSVFDFGLHTPVNALVFVALVVIATSSQLRSRGGMRLT